MAEELVECRYYESADGFLHCHLCPFNCKIRPGKVGACRVRKNDDGVLRSLNYAQVTSVALDPIEKKPLYHFYPGTKILSLGTFGCNLSCVYCQNWQISQRRPSTRYLAPDQAVQMAQEQVRRGNNIGIAYTYNEPIIWYEYVYDTARLAQEAGLKNVLVTNGIIEEEPLRDLLPYMDAMNVDIKSMDEQFYHRLCKGMGWPARRTVEIAIERCHVEITVLIIPGENDSDEDLVPLFDWAASVDKQLPVHLSAYRPAYQFDAPPTPPETLRRAWELARQRLQFVYVGNLFIDGTTDTQCPQCGATAVRRSGFGGRIQQVTDQGRCSNCGAPLNIIR